jgi:hypothetical protein
VRVLVYLTPFAAIWACATSEDVPRFDSIDGALVANDGGSARRARKRGYAEHRCDAGQRRKPGRIVRSLLTFELPELPSHLRHSLLPGRRDVRL